MTQPELGKRISELRLSKGLTQQDLADKRNLNVRTIQRIQAGKVAPRYTLNLLTTPLDIDLNALNQTTPEVRTLSGKIKLAYIAGIVYITNAIPLTYYLMGNGIDKLSHILITTIDVVSSIFFLMRFYFIGKSYKNWLLAISSLIMCILLPAINILDLLKNVYFSVGLFVLFLLMAINMIVIGSGLIKESLERKGYENSGAYYIAGILTIVISVLYLTLNSKIINAGILLSFPSNLLMVYLLFKESHDPAKRAV